ncbi:MAG: aryl-sulfate sulfotransferase [Chloroflexota bacterium]
MKYPSVTIAILGLILSACAPASTPTPLPIPSATIAAPTSAPPSITPTLAPTPTTAPSPTRATPTPAFPRGKVDPDWSVDVYDPELAASGTTLFADNHNLAAPRIVEVNLLGEIVWEYRLPENWRQYTNPGFDIEPLANGNVLFVLPRKGAFEIDRAGKVVWSYATEQISHDADRLPNGNTLVVFGAMDRMNDAQVKEINPRGEIVWAWYARDQFNRSPYKEISEEGWTHTNAASRLENGNTLISLRNFHIVVEVDPKGAVIKTYGEGLFRYPHDPQALANGNILLANHVDPQRAIEIDPQTGQVVWQFVMPRQLVRDANRLPNGNTLITGSSAIVEVTRQGKVVWQLNLRTPLERQEGPARGFYKAERIGSGAR